MQQNDDNQTGFELYSDRIARKFPTYKLDAELRLYPGPETLVVNFNEIKDILLSKDLSQNEKLDWTKQ